MASSAGTAGSIAERWRELQGERSWDGLLDPLDLDLRKSIISYGELVQAAEEAFIGDKHSPNAGLCMYGHSNLLTMSTVAAPGHYEVTKFLYATAGEKYQRDAFLVLPRAGLKGASPSSASSGGESNWMGFVAVATNEGVAALGRRDIVVVWRGTVTAKELDNDFNKNQVSAATVLGSAARDHRWAQVHAGFLSLYTSTMAGSKHNSSSARDQVREEVKRLVEQYKDEPTSITVTGHSLGAAVSVLSAVDMVANGVNTSSSSSSSSSNNGSSPCPVAAILFACPRVGNDHFSTAFLSFKDVAALHVKNANDMVPGLPVFWYAEVPAVVLPVDTNRSPYLKDLGIISGARHDLEVYLHGVAGVHGSAGGEFKLEVDRDVALANKRADVLKDEYPVAPGWWVQQYKSMVKNDQGKWELRDMKH